MADHYNKYQLTHFAATVADAMELPLPEEFEKPVDWFSAIIRQRLGGKADRALLYHADAVGMYMWQKYTELFAPVYKHTSLSLPFESTVMSVTPVAHASMYTGLMPAQHGIQTYTRPQLACTTLYDVLLKAGLRPCILAQTDSTFLHIFAGRNMDYFEEPNAIAIQEKAMELLSTDKYDVISIHTFDYDDAAHAYGPESKEGLNAIAIEAQGFADMAAYIEKEWQGKHRTLLTYSPDHGQHLIDGNKGSHGSKLIEDMNVLHFFGTKN